MIETLRHKYKSCIEAIGLDPASYAISTKPTHDGGPHIETEGDEYCYVVTERGSEFERRRTPDVDEICYWLVRDLTSYWAFQFELANRIEKLDCRYIAFDCEEKLMARICQDWSRRVFDYHESLLKHPYPIPDRVANKALNWTPSAPVS